MEEALQELTKALFRLPAIPWELADQGNYGGAWAVFLIELVGLYLLVKLPKLFGMWRVKRNESKRRRIEEQARKQVNGHRAPTNGSNAPTEPTAAPSGASRRESAPVSNVGMHDQDRKV